MKKFTSLLFVMIAAVVFGLSTVSAKTEQELRDHIANTPVVINGKSTYLKKEYVNMVDDYLKRTELSSADCDYLYARIDEIKALLESEKTTDSAKLSKDAKKQLKAMLTKAATETSVQFTVEGTLVTVTAGDGTKYAVELANKDPFASTGSDNLIIVGAAAIAIIGLGFGVRKFRKLNA
jgi:hypothetical protein